MTARNTADGYGWVSIALHWVTVLLIVGLVLVGMWMTDLPNGPQKIQVYALHKSTGLTVLTLSIARLAWRFFAGAPALVPMPSWQRLAANASHVALYVLLLAIPVSGWLFNSAAGFPLKWFGLVRVPPLAAYDPALKALAREAHETLAWTLVAVAVVHAAAALQHHFMHRDITLHRMLPLLRAPSPKLPEPP